MTRYTIVEQETVTPSTVFGDIGQSEIPKVVPRNIRAITLVTTEFIS